MTRAVFTGVGEECEEFHEALKENASLLSMNRKGKSYSDIINESVPDISLSLSSMSLPPAWRLLPSKDFWFEGRRRRGDLVEKFERERCEIYSRTGSNKEAFVDSERK